MTLRARLPVLSALCVTPINLYAPPSSLPFLCSITDSIETSWAAVAEGAQVSATATTAAGPLFCFPNRKMILSFINMISTEPLDAAGRPDNRIKIYIILLHGC